MQKISRLHNVVLQSLVFLYFVQNSCSTDSGQHILQHVKSRATPEQQEAAVLGVITRLIGQERAAQFTITIDVQLKANTFQLHRGKSDEKVQIRASSGTAACKGFHHYLKYYCGCHISWDGDQLDRLPAIWPIVEHSETAASSVMYYQNVCTWSYSFEWWKWPEWRRHIDWMALNGITLTLAPVQEFAWTSVYRELGMTQAEIDRHIAGPSFLAWQRMGNLRGWGGPLPEHFKAEQSELQKQVIAAQRELGMVVALPAFAGHVPADFARIFPNSSMSPASRWMNFGNEYCCPLYIDPVDPLFQRIGQMFLRTITELYGSDHIFFADPFNELTPPKGDLSFIAHSSKSIFNAMVAVDQDAVWLLQGWMFVNLGDYWTSQRSEAFLRAVPLGRMLVLDLQSETAPQYQRMHYYFGQPWIWCMLHNFGGTLGMHGSVEVLNTHIAPARLHPDSTMLGFGLTMEGIHQNTVVYDFALERGWDQKTVDSRGWFDFYATTRYGRQSDSIQAALQLLRESVYSYHGNTGLYGQYVLCKRPGLQLSTYTWYNYDDVERALLFLYMGAHQGAINDLLHHDLVDLARQYLQTRIELLYRKIGEYSRTKNVQQFQNMTTLFESCLNSMQVILNSHSAFMLGPELQRAQRWVHSDSERQLYEFNVRNQISGWGPQFQLLDYAYRQWAEVIVEYCLPRWKLFFDESLAAMKLNGTIDMAKFTKRVQDTVEIPFMHISNKSISVEPIGNTMELVLVVLDKWYGKSI